MANAFESFIQLELPKRPYLESDPAQESLIVRRGSGPRQLSGLTLQEGQTVVFKDGELKPAPYGVPGESSSVTGLAHEQAAAATVWNITHNQANREVVVTILDEEYAAIISDSIEVLENSIVIKFLTPQSGFVNIVFL